MLKVRENHFSRIPMRFETIMRSDGSPYIKRDALALQRYFFPDEWMAFYDALKNSQQRITFKILVNTGARINEVRHIQVKDIDFYRRSILLREVKTRVRTKTQSGETSNKNWRAISISKEFSNWLEYLIKKNRMDKEDYFPVLSTNGANVALKNALRRLGFKDWRAFSVHNIRKTVETWLLSLGLDSLRVTKHIGHDIRTAQKYYVSPDTFSYEDKQNMRKILGDLLEN